MHEEEVPEEQEGKGPKIMKRHTMAAKKAAQLAVQNQSKDDTLHTDRSLISKGSKGGVVPADNN